MADSLNPYAPPTADEVFAPELSNHLFQPTQGLSVALRAMLGISVGLTAISVVADLMQIDLLRRIGGGGNFTGEEVTANDQRIMLIAGIYLTMLLATAIVWFVWQARTSKNARALGATFMEFGPHAWGWFFCPILNLWRPLQVINELWRVTSPKDDGAQPPSWFFAWWIPWILAGIITQISTRMATDPTDAGQAILSTQLGIAASVMTITAGVSAIAIVKHISQREHARAAR